MVFAQAVLKLNLNHQTARIFMKNEITNYEHGINHATSYVSEAIQKNEANRLKKQDGAGFTQPININRLRLKRLHADISSVMVSVHFAITH